MQYIQIILLIVIIGLLIKRNKPTGVVSTVRSGRSIIIDTCGLIDGRITELAKLGFVPPKLIIPDFVLHELQMLADGSDAQKRERARYGLDVVQELQQAEFSEVTIDRSITSSQPTDDKLVTLATTLSAGLYTTDYNLNKVAEIGGVQVLNINELAQSMRPVALPGEYKTVKIIQKGSNPKQGVGYLEDGTMVVIDNAAGLKGKTVKVEVTRMHQTQSGKMLFGSIVATEAPSKPKLPTFRRRRPPVAKAQG